MFTLTTSFYTRVNLKSSEKQKFRTKGYPDLKSKNLLNVHIFFQGQTDKVYSVGNRGWREVGRKGLGWWVLILLLRRFVNTWEDFYKIKVPKRDGRATRPDSTRSSRGHHPPRLPPDSWLPVRLTSHSTTLTSSLTISFRTLLRLSCMGSTSYLSLHTYVQGCINI